MLICDLLCICSLCFFSYVFYLSEQALTDNIELLEKENELDFHITNIFAPKIQTDEEQFIEDKDTGKKYKVKTPLQVYNICKKLKLFKN